MTQRQELIFDLLQRFPQAANRALARKAMKEAPSMFLNFECARQAFIKARNGVEGKRKPLVDHRTPFSSNGRPFHKIPEGKTHFLDWKPLVIDGPIRPLILADLHIPYHDRGAIIAALKFGKKNGANAVILNGDIGDFFSISFWEKDPRKRDFAEELQTVREFITTVRQEFPKARLIYKLGNHEERWERYMFVKAPELLDVPEFQFDKLLGLHPEEIVGDKRPIRLGDLNLIHGHEYRFAISNPVNAARGLFLRAKAYAMCAHHHQTSSHSERTVEQKNRGTWSIGCLCDLHPDYMPLNNWNHGLGFVEVFSGGKFAVQNKFISESGMVY